MEPQIVVSANKTLLNSIYGFYDLFPFKKYHQCNIQIPQTIMLENGFIQDWIFNSHKIPTHPLLKKKKENMSMLAVAKTFCSKFGYNNITHNSSSIPDLHTAFKAAKREENEQERKKHKKCIEITTVEDEKILMSVSEFLNILHDIHREQKFPEKWKLIQERVSYQKIEEYYFVENIRDNHLVESKCQKIIKVNKTDSPKKSVEQQEPQTTKEQSYKFFDAVLNKKFFQMSADLVQFIEKNFKCFVQSLNTKFMLNPQREPYLVGMYNIQIKPHKDIANMKDFQLKKENGSIMVDEYIKCLQVLISKIPQEKGALEHDKGHIKKAKKVCKGRFCKIYILEHLHAPDNKFKIPMGPRIVSTEMRDATVKNQLLVIQTLKQNRIIQIPEKKNSKEESEYQTSENELALDPEQRKVKLKPIEVKVCENCFKFYFYVDRYFDLHDYDLNLKAKQPKIKLLGSPKKTTETEEIAEMRGKTELPLIKPVTSLDNEKYGKTQLTKNKSNPKFLSPLKKKQTNKHKNFQSDKKLPPSQSKIKLDPLMGVKRYQNQESMGGSLANLPKMNHQINLKERLKPQKKHLVPISERRPDNYIQGTQQLIKKLAPLPNSHRQEFIFYAKKYQKQNFPQPIDRRSFSSFYLSHLYEFMSNSPITIHPKRRIKKRPEMSLKRLSELTDYPEIVSRSQFIFDTLIVTEQITIPFCILTTKVVNPENIKSDVDFENIFIVNDIFDSFIEHISMAKQILEEENCFNKRIILFNYPGQCHTIYNSDHIEGVSANFSFVMDKLLYRLSHQKGQLRIINFKKDVFKFCGLGYGSYLLSSYLGSYHYYFQKISAVFLLNPFMQMPESYEEMLKNLLLLYSSDDPTAKSQAFFFYNKAIDSSQIEREELSQKSGVNPIRLADRVYLIKSVLKEIQDSKTRMGSVMPIFFQNLENCNVSVAYGSKNKIIPKKSSLEFMKYRKNEKEEIPKRTFTEVENAGHDAFADNYDDVYEFLHVFACK